MVLCRRGISGQRRLAEIPSVAASRSQSAPAKENECMQNLDRRSFIKVVGAAAAGTQMKMLSAEPQDAGRRIAANDNIQIALIGAGGQGQSDTRMAVQVPGVKLVAVADCYDGRLAHSKEVWGADIFTTRDYAQILERKDIDAVIIG